MSNAESVEVLTVDQVIGRRVHQLMWDRKVTARALGSQIGVDPSGVGRRLRGERGWSSDELVATARFFDLSVAVLFGEQRPEPTPVERSYPSV